MSIEVKKPKRDIYVRIWPRTVDSRVSNYSGKVGKVISESVDIVSEAGTVVIVSVAGEIGTHAFNGKDLELITKKEYFKRALSG